MREKACRTRDAILDVAKRLFLERGYGGTRIEHIATACGISRASFYTYFPSKRDVFLVLGTATYRELNAAVAAFDRLSDPCPIGELEGWVHRYFGFMAEHGAFMLSASQTGPDDEDIRGVIRELQPRVCRRLGRSVQHRRSGGDSGDALTIGVVTLGMLDRAWFLCHVAQLPGLSDGELVPVLARMLAMSLGEGAVIGDA